MHDIDTTRLEMQSSGISEEAPDFTSEFEEEFELGMKEPLSEAEEMELATDLLSVSSEAELDQFIGKLFKKAWGGIKKVGSKLRKVVKPFAGTIRSLAKKALPFVGGALGSFIPIPGVGTAVGSALGGAVSNALEAELEGMAPEDREFEMARRFVRLSTSAAQRLAQTPPGQDPRAAILSAFKSALSQQRSQSNGQTNEAAESEDAFMAEISGQRPESSSSASQSGRWIRRGKTIVLIGV